MSEISNQAIQAKFFLMEVLEKSPNGINHLSTLGLIGNISYIFKKVNAVIEQVGETTMEDFIAAFTDSLELREFLSVSLRSYPANQSSVKQVVVRGWGFSNDAYFPIQVRDLKQASPETLSKAVDGSPIKFMEVW